MGRGGIRTGAKRRGEVGAGWLGKSPSKIRDFESASVQTSLVKGDVGGIELGRGKRWEDTTKSYKGARRKR